MAAAVYSIIVSTIARVWTMEIEREMGTERYLIGSTRIHNDRKLALAEQAEREPGDHAVAMLFVF